MAVANIKSYQPMVHTEPHKDNVASQAAANILNSSGANPKPPKAINDITSGENSRINGLLGNTGVGNGATGNGATGNGATGNGATGNGISSSGTNSPVKNIQSSFVNSFKNGQKPVIPSGTDNSQVQQYADRFSLVKNLDKLFDYSYVPPSLPKSDGSFYGDYMSKPNITNGFMQPTLVDKLVSFRPKVQTGQYLNSKGIDTIYDPDTNGLYANGYHIPVTNVDNDVPYSYKRVVDDIIDKITYGGNPSDMMAVKQYVGDKGSVTFNPDTGEYYLNGTKIPGAKVENGIFYAPKGEIDNILGGPYVDSLQYLNTKGINPTYDEGSGDYFYNGYKMPTGSNTSQTELDALVDRISSGGTSDDIIGVRAYVGDKGDLEYDAKTGKVYLNGLEVPVTQNENGRVYAKRGDIDKILSTHDYKNGNIVNVRDYVAKYGGDVSTRYDAETGNVFLNGIKLDIDHISDGRSYADKSLIDRIIKQTVINNPQSRYNVVNNILESTDAMRDEINSLRRNDRFEYDYRDDPSYNAYSDEYDYQMKRDIENAVGSAMLRTGGYNNSTAGAVEALLRQQYGARKSALIPQLEQQAFERWNAGRQNDIELLGTAGSLYDNVAKTMADIYGTNLNADMQRYTTDADNNTKLTISDNELNLMDKQHNNEMALDWNKLTWDVEHARENIQLEKDKLAQTKDSATKTQLIEILNKLEGFNGQVSPTALQSIYAQINALDLTDEQKQYYFDVINATVGTNFRLIDEVIAEREAQAEASVATNPVVDNILNSYYYTGATNDPSGLLGNTIPVSTGHVNTGPSWQSVYGFDTGDSNKESNIVPPPTSPYYYDKQNNSDKSDKNKTTKSTTTTKNTGGGNTQTGKTVTSEVAPGFKWQL